MELSHRTERNESALDALEHELYNPKNKMEDISLHNIKDRRNIELPTSWGDDAPIITQAKDTSGMSFGSKLLIISIFVLICAMSFMAWRVVSLRNVVSSANIDMALDVVPYVEGGESTPLTFTLFNRNTSPLQNASITLVYKQGIGSQDEQEKIQEKRDIGTINPNDNKRQDFNIVLYGGESEQRDITLKLEYKVAGSAATFSKIISASTVLKTPQMSVHVDGPNVLSIGQNGTFNITVKNNSATSSIPSILQLVLPNTFTILSQDPKPISRGAVWSIPSLAPGEEATTTIVGYLEGTSGETTSMRAILGSVGDDKTTIGIVYSSQNIDIKLRTSPLNFSIALDTDSGTTDKIRYGDRATLTIDYVNTSDITLQNVSLEMLISGDAPMLKQINPTNGYYDSEKQTILWDKANLSELATLAPHANGTLKVIIPIATSGANSPKLKVLLTGTGSSVKTDDVVSKINKTWAVQGSATISAKTTYKNSPFPGSGPIPPVVNTETVYTAHLLVSAQNALTNTRVSFILPSYVTWQNKTSDSSKVTYDSRSRTVTWLIGNLDAEKTSSMDISLGLKPSQSHVGQMPSITSGIVLDADEEVSKAHINTTMSALTTFISGENWPGNPSKVIDRQ